MATITTEEKFFQINNNDVQFCYQGQSSVLGKHMHPKMGTKLGLRPIDAIYIHVHYLGTEKNRLNSLHLNPFQTAFSDSLIAIHSDSGDDYLSLSILKPLSTPE